MVWGGVIHTPEWLKNVKMLFANSMIKPQDFTTKRATARFLTMALHI
jgi:hypothetical protein